MKYKLFRCHTNWKSKLQKMRQECTSDNWLEGVRLNLFGGSIQDTVNYLKERDTKR